MDKITFWFNGLSNREQNILLIALPVVLLIIGLMVVNKTRTSLLTEQDNHQHLLEQYSWLRSDTQAIMKWRAKFGRKSLGELNSSEELGLRLNEGLSSNRIRGSVTPNESLWRVNINPSDGNRVLSYIEAAVGSGAIPVQIKLTRADTKGKISGQILFEPLIP